MPNGSVAWCIFIATYCMCLPVDASESSTPARVPVEETDRQAFLEVLHNQKITSVLQPIVSLRDGAVFGYEALGRGPAGTLLENPETLIQCALENGCMASGPCWATSATWGWAFLS